MIFQFVDEMQSNYYVINYLKLAVGMMESGLYYF